MQDNNELNNDYILRVGGHAYLRMLLNYIPDADVNLRAFRGTDQKVRCAYKAFAAVITSIDSYKDKRAREKHSDYLQSCEYNESIQITGMLNDIIFKNYINFDRSSSDYLETVFNKYVDLQIKLQTFYLSIKNAVPTFSESIEMAKMFLDLCLYQKIFQNEMLIGPDFNERLLVAFNKMPEESKAVDGHKLNLTCNVYFLENRFNCLTDESFDYKNNKTHD